MSVHGHETGPCGIGFLYTDDTVVTCAHVVCQALGLPPDHPDPPDEPITLEFLLLNDGTRITARVTAWRPGGGEKPDDIAVLRLAGQLPAGAEPVRMSIADDLWDHRVAAFGVPRDNEKDGAWATGELRGHRAGGLIQVDDDRPNSGFTIQQGFSGSPVWDEEVGAVVGMVISASQRRKFACIVPTAVLLDVLPLVGLPANPYRGLLSFREEDAQLFFGRDALADALAEDVRTRRVTVVVGPSGYGKSSLVAAGLLPRLRKRSELVIAGPIRPRGNPANEIAGALIELLQPRATPTQQLADRPAMAKMITEGRLDEVVGTVLGSNGADELLLIIDQLEEALDRGSSAVAALSPVIRGAFVPSSQLRLLLVIRADFLDRALARPELAEGLQEVSTVGAMTREQLHAAVTGPLRAGVTFETGLDRQIVAEVATAPGQLPLLQSVLDQLWQRQEGGRLTHRAYTDLGGVSGALARYAEKKGWAELDEDDRAIARRLFMRLVWVDPDLPTTRRPVRRTQVSDQEWQLAQRLVNARLLVGSRRETVELTHEALISHWDRLRDWIEQDREFRAWQDSVGELAVSAELNTIKPKELLKQSDLTKAVHWRQTRPEELSPGEHRLIHRSLHARRAKWFRATRLALVLAVVAAVVSSAFDQWPHLFNPDRNPAEELARDLADKPITDTTLLQTIAAYNADPGNEYTVRELFSRYNETRQVTAVLTDPSPDIEIDAVSASSDGHVVVTRFATGATLWRETGGRMVPIPLKVPSPDDVAVTADGTLVVVTSGREVRLFDDRGHSTRGFTVPQPKDGTTSARLAVAVADGVIATRRSDEPVVRVWNLYGQQLSELPVGAGHGPHMWLADGGRTLVTRTNEFGEVRLWDVATRVSRLITETSAAAVVNPLGDTLVTCHNDEGNALVRVHQLRGPGQVAELPWDIAEYCGRVTIDPSGRYLGILTDYSVSVYDLAEQRFVTGFQKPEGAPKEPAGAPALVVSSSGMLAVQPAGKSVLIYAMPFNLLETYPYKSYPGVFSVDGKYVATSEYSGEPSVVLWDVRTHRRVKEEPTRDEPTSIEFDASGRYLVVAYWDGVEVRAVPSLELLHPIRFPPNENLAPPEVHLDERGHLLASYASKISRWDLATGERIGQPIPAEAPDSLRGATVFAVMPDGSQLVAVSQNRHALHVWDLTTNRPRRVPVTGVAVTGVVATPWPGRVLVLRQPDKSSTVLELWDLRVSRPTGKVLLDNLANDYSVTALRNSVGFDDDWIIQAGGYGINTWNSSGDEHVTVVETFTSFGVMAVRGRTMLFPDGHMVSPEPDRWRDSLCDLLGRPDEAPDMPDGIDTTNLCP